MDSVARAIFMGVGAGANIVLRYAVRRTAASLSDALQPRLTMLTQRCVRFMQALYPQEVVGVVLIAPNAEGAGWTAWGMQQVRFHTLHRVLGHALIRPVYELFSNSSNAGWGRQRCRRRCRRRST